MLLIVGASGGSGTSEERVRMNESYCCFGFCIQVNEIFFLNIFFLHGIDTALSDSNSSYNRECIILA